jgi:predicted PurR-regulated permease PerM
VWTAALVLLLLEVVYLARRTIFVFVVALLLAYLMAPLVNLLDRVLPASRTRTRTPALAISYVILVGGLVLIGGQIGTEVVAQANALSRRAPELLDNWKAPPPGFIGPMSLERQLIEQARSEIMKRSGDIVSELPRAGIRILSLASNLIDVVIVPVLAFFFLKDGRVMREHLLAWVDPGPRRVLLDDVLADVHLLLAHYMRALVLLSFAAFVCYSIGFAVIGVPYGLLLASTACLLEFIPMLGPLAAGLIIVAVAAVAGAPVGVVVAFLVAFRVFQDYLLSPQLMGTGVELHPLLVLFGVFAGAEVAGVPGTFLSVPLLAAARIVWVRMRKSRIAAVTSLV